MIKRYSEKGNVGKGKFTPAEAEAVFYNLPPYMADVAEFAYPQHAPPVIDVVPIEVRIADQPASSSLPDLAWSGDQGHLAMSPEVVG
jgi:hypothetical protein